MAHTGAATAHAQTAGEEAHALARSIAAAGPRPAGSPAERRAQDRVAARFRRAGLRLATDTFAVPKRGVRSRNVIGIRDTPARCLIVLMAHSDTVPPAPGADDNASGLGTLAALATRLPAEPACDVWLVATGAEERIHTGSPDHLGALALVRRVKRLGRARDLRFALSLDEVGRGTTFWLRSPVAQPRPRVERALLTRADDAGVAVRWVADSGTGNSDHREFELAGLPAMKLGVPDDPCRHEACDTPSRLQRGAFDRVIRVVRRVLAG
ncbi:MAG TPA: M28 family peptidase [Solirubrobacteraceae bacterium]|nr:M28 family peptidase [Solirubrobacteraceae bacterium]